MIFPLTATGLFLLPTLLLALVTGAVLLVRRRPQRRFWWAVLWVHLFLTPVHAFVTFPGFLGWWGSRGLGTRGDESNYLGPRLAEDGTWIVQRGGAVAAADAPGTVVPPTMIEGSGVTLRAFHVPVAAEQGPPRAAVILVHGLFRSALEIEAPGRMFRELGCDVWLVEQRNFGGSGRAPASFGLRESEDLVAVAQFVRARPDQQDLPLLFFGVSLGTVSIAMALPAVGGVRGVVLDAPVADFLGTARRMMSMQGREGRRRRFAIDEPWQSLVLAAVQLWSGIDFTDIRPAAALTGLPTTLPVLLVAGAHDEKVPVADVRSLYDSLPMRTGTKELWVVEDAAHGDSWDLHPGDYEARLRAFLARALSR